MESDTNEWLNWTEHGFSSCNAGAYFSQAYSILVPQLQLKLKSPALQSGFLTTGPSGESPIIGIFISCWYAFELWCWRRLLRVPWTARRSNQSILKEISPGCSLEGLMLKLKRQYFGHLMWRVDSLEKTRCWEGLGAGGEGDDRGWDGWMASLTRWTWVWVNSGSWWWTGRPGMLQFMGSQRVGHDWATELNWTDIH